MSTRHVVGTKQKPRRSGVFSLPALTTVPVVDIFLGSILFIAVTLLDLPLELLALAIDDVEVVVGEFASLLLDLTLHLLPVTFNAIPIHWALPLYFSLHW